MLFDLIFSTIIFILIATFFVYWKPSRLMLKEILFRPLEETLLQQIQEPEHKVSDENERNYKSMVSDEKKDINRESTEEPEVPELILRVENSEEEIRDLLKKSEEEMAQMRRVYIELASIHTKQSIKARRAALKNIKRNVQILEANPNYSEIFRHRIIDLFGKAKGASEHVTIE